MAHFTIRQQQERERREWRERAEREQAERLAAERQRIANLKNQWREVSMARAHAALAGYQYARWSESARRLIALDAFINKN